jgi:hypothetical protein
LAGWFAGRAVQLAQVGCELAIVQLPYAPLHLGAFEEKADTILAPTRPPWRARQQMDVTPFGKREFLQWQPACGCALQTMILAQSLLVIRATCATTISSPFAVNEIPKYADSGFLGTCVSRVARTRASATDTRQTPPSPPTAT